MRPEKLTLSARNLARELWTEQLAAGIGTHGEIVTEEGLENWLWNRDGETLQALQDAADGDAGALVYVRNEAGLPTFC